MREHLLHYHLLFSINYSLCILQLLAYPSLFSDVFEVSEGSEDILTYKNRNDQLEFS